jgi:hypothetical protein
MRQELITNKNEGEVRKRQSNNGELRKQKGQFRAGSGKLRATKVEADLWIGESHQSQV